MKKVFYGIAIALIIIAISCTKEKGIKPQLTGKSESSINNDITSIARVGEQNIFDKYGAMHNDFLIKLGNKVI